MHVVRWDQSPEFLGGIRVVQGTLDGRDEGTKAADVVGVRDRDIWVFEIKDFRNRLDEWEKRSKELPLEIALKVRDTLAGVIGSHHQRDAEPWSRAVASRLVATTPLTVVAVIARPARWRNVPPGKRKVQNDVLMKRTRQLLAWVSRRVLVIDPMLAEELVHLPDVAVASLAQSKPAQK